MSHTWFVKLWRLLNHLTVSIELTKQLYTVDPRTTLLTLACIIKVTNGTEVYGDLALQLQASFIEGDH